MFDPSKLDLNLDENKEKKDINLPEKTESEKIEEHKQIIQDNKQTKEQNDNDDLSTLFQSEKSSGNNQEKIVKLNEPIETNSISPIVEEPLPLGEDEKLKLKDNNNNYGIINDSRYDKQVIIDAEKEKTEQKIENNKIIFDTNLKGLQDIFNKLIEKKYDFVTIEPFDDAVKIIYRKDKVEKEALYIKYPVYTQILIKGKTLTQLKVDDVESTQEGHGVVILKSKTYKVTSKTVASGYGEKIFLKLQEDNTKKKKIEKKPISLSHVFGFLGAALFAALVIGGGFLTFVLLNSNTVADLTFFNSLGVDVGSIRDFTSQLVNTIFAIILIIESLFLFTLTFKALLTKREYKKQKITKTIFAIFFLILTFISAFLWITLSKKINDLKGQNYGKMITYDNSKYLSNIFDEQGSIIDIDQSLIGPVTLRFDVSEIINQLVNDNNYTPKSITWRIGGKEEKQKLNDTGIIHTFDTKDLHIVNLEIEVLNALGEPEVLNKEVAKIDIKNIVDINEKRVTGGGVIYQLNASNLKDLGKVEWYYIPDLNNLTDAKKTETISDALEQPANTGYLFDSKILYDEELILGIKIITTDEPKDELDKIFVFTSENNGDEIKADIIAKQEINDDFEYTLNVSNLETLVGNGTIESFLWRIGDKTIKKDVDLTDIENSSKISYTFPSYGTFNVYLDIYDSRGNNQTIEKEIIIEKKLQLSKSVIIRNNKDPIENLEYNKNLHEYVIDEIGVPTIISLDARFIKSADINYVLRNIEWDFDSDDDIDSTDKNTTYEVAYEGSHKITGLFYFEHRKKSEDKIIVKENFYIEGIEKEAQIDFKITKDSQYAPVTVSFDASRSQVKNEDIVKFEWDYGDGITEIRDAIVPGHKYGKSGDYEVKLTITTESGKIYTASKKLVLKPKQQDIEINVSMKTAPTYQEIDFLSDKSEGQISSYFWDFGDGGTSTKANPSYQYIKPGTYTVKLRLDFANNNVLEKNMEIIITDD